VSVSAAVGCSSSDFKSQSPERSLLFVQDLEDSRCRLVDEGGVGGESQQMLPVYLSRSEVIQNFKTQNFYST
jgi:hypothetical protein